LERYIEISERQRLAAVRAQLRSAFAQLPAPKNEVQIVGPDGDDEAEPRQRRSRMRAGPPVGTAAVAARGGLRMVREVELTVGAQYAPLTDVAVSGFGGWITVVAGSGRRAGVQLVRLQVWVPRGAEVFTRPPMPVFPRDGYW
jgi:hypothetical protein